MSRREHRESLMSNSSKKKNTPKAYTPEFRLNAVKLAQSQDKSISQTARDLGIPLATLHTWVNAASRDELGQLEGNTTAVKVDKSAKGKPSNISQKLYEQLSAEQRKSADLERQVRRLTQEREILKKAMAYCLDVPK
jgi:transposase